MLATPGPVPSGPEWAFEVKFDGIRLMATFRRGRLSLSSRNEKDLTAAFPELGELAARLTADGVRSVVLDGELVARGPGPPSLQAIAPRIHRRSAPPALQKANPVTYVVFDILELDGHSQVSRPWHARIRTLAGTLPGGSATWQQSEVFDDGAALWEATAQQGFEGVVAKRRESAYQPGVRSRDWVKSVHRTTADLVVVGWRPESGRGRQVGSLVLAEAVDGALRHVGSAGSGLGNATAEALSEVLPTIERADPAVPIQGEVAGTRWVEPALVVTVRTHGRTRDRRLRQPVIVALRPDLTAADLIDPEAL